MNVQNVLSYCRRKTSFFFRPFIFEFNTLGYAMILLCSLNILNVHAFDHKNMSYVDECKVDCKRLRDPFTCAKFRAVQWLHNFTNEKDMNYGRSIRFIRMSAPPMEEALLPELPRSREFGRYSKFLNYVRSCAEDMLTRRALVYTMEQDVNPRSLSSGPLILDAEELDEFVESGRSVEEGRLGLKKKKKTLSVILPLIILLKVFKLKLLLIPIFIAVHFIKKIVLLGALALPSILANLKYCKIQSPMVPHHGTPYSTWSTAAETPIDYSITSTGHEDESWNQKIDTIGYGGISRQDMLVANAQRNPYRGYYQALKQRQLQNLL